MSTPAPPDGFGTTPGALRDDAAAAESVSSDSLDSSDALGLPSARTESLSPAGSDDDAASEPADSIDSTISDATSTARSTLADALDRLSGMVDSAVQRRDEWMQSARDEVRAHPMAAVAAAFVAGIVFDRMRRPGSSRGR